MNNDLQLVKKWQEGDFKAEEQLVNRYYKGVKQHIANLAMGNLDIASDLTTDTFIKAKRKIHQFDVEQFSSDTSFQSWLWMIAKRLTIDYFRKLRIQGERNTTLIASREKGSPKKVPEEKGPGARTRLYNVENAQILEKALSQLKPKYRRLFELLKVEGRTRKDAAKILGVTEDTARGWYRTGLKKLKENLPKDLEY